MDLSFKFRQGFENDSLVQPGDSILVAVSGGIDSCVLLHLLAGVRQEMGLSLTVGHVNHGLRGAQSEADEVFVRSISKKYSLTFCSDRFPGVKDGENLQDAAREFRYGALMRMAEENGATKIAFAHNRNDQAETVLLNLIRGAGLDGLSGIPKCRKLSESVTLIRPILSFGRKEIADFAGSSRVDYREDSSNSSTKYSRNMVRHNILPELLKINPRAIDHIFETADFLRADDEFLDGLAADLLARMIDKTDKTAALVVSRKTYLNQPVVIRRRLSRLAFKRLTGSTKDLKADHIFRIDQIACSGDDCGSYSLPSGVHFERKAELLFFSRK